jgi:hypothetical protein
MKYGPRIAIIHPGVITYVQKNTDALAAEDPLLDMLPIEWDTLHLLGIGCQPEQQLMLLGGPAEELADEEELEMLEEDKRGGSGYASDHFESLKRSRAAAVDPDPDQFNSSSLRSSLRGSLRVLEMRTYFEIQRGDQISRRSRKYLSNSIHSEGGMSTSSTVAFARKLRSQSSIHRNR